MKTHCIVECCDKGLLLDERCVCDIGAFGVECEDNLQDLYPAPYYTFQGVFCLGFFILLAITIQQFKTSLRTQKIPSYYTCFQYAMALYGSPQNYLLVLTIILCCCKLVWLILDPLEVYKGKTPVIERNLAEVVYTLLFYIYGCLLIVWYTMYDEISYNVYQGQQRKWIFKYYKEVLKARLFLVLLVQITISTMNGLRQAILYPAFKMFCQIFLMGNFLIFIMEFLIYGYSLSECIKYQIKLINQNKPIQVKQEKIDQQVESMSKSPESVQRLARISRQISMEDQKNEIIDEVKQIEETTKPKIQNLSKMRSVQFARTFIKGARGSSLFRQESQKQLKTNNDKKSDPSSKDLDQFKEDQPIEENSCCLQDDEQLQNWDNNLDKQIVVETIKIQMKIVKETKELAFKKKPVEQQQQQSTTKRSPIYRTENKKLSILSNMSQSQSEQKTSLHQEDYYEKYSLKTSNLAIDRQILFKIQLLVYIGIALEILFGILSIILLVTDLMKNPIGVMVYLYVSSFLQFFSIVTALKLFKDIKNQEVKNLIWIQKVGSKKNKINSQYAFSIPNDQGVDEQKQKFVTRINLNAQY